MEIERRREASGDVVGLRGELDLTNSHQLAEALAATSTQAVVLDLSLLAFVDSAGIRTIDRARRRFDEAGRRLLVVAPADSRAGWTFRVAGLGEGHVLGSMEHALAAAAESNGGRPTT
jgi:anti-anti-sigma factor